MPTIRNLHSTIAVNMNAYHKKFVTLLLFSRIIDRKTGSVSTLTCFHHLALNEIQGTSSVKDNSTHETENMQKAEKQNNMNMGWQD